MLAFMLRIRNQIKPDSLQDYTIKDKKSNLIE